MTTDHPAATIVSGALRQCKTELRIQLLSPASVVSWLFFPVIGLVVLILMGDRHVMGSDVDLAQIGVPGVLTMYLITGGLIGIAGALVTESEDGTLLRAKAIPNGMRSHLLGNVVTYTVVALAPILVLLLASMPVVDGVAPSTPARWLTFAWVAVLGLAATLPWGAALGALLRGPIALLWVAIAAYAMIAISGVFYPLAALPDWLQLIGRILPTYWIGLGLRSALLPDDAVALEFGQTWATGPTVLVLATWAVIGIVIAPIALQRLARRQTGSVVAAARERVMSRGY